MPQRFNDDAMRRIAQTVKKVEGLEPPRPPRDPRELPDQMPWLKIIGKTRADCADQWVYSANVYRHPYATETTATGQLLVNAAEQAGSPRNIKVDEWVRATDIIKVDLGYGGGLQVMYVCRVELSGPIKGIVTDAPDCEGYVTAVIEGCDNPWKIYLVWPEAKVYNKAVGAGDEILFMPLDTGSESPEGIAISPEVDYVGLQVNDNPEVRKIRNVNVLNEHGPDDRPDFNAANLALVTELECADQVDLGLNWNGNDVLSYVPGDGPSTLKQIRVFDFGATEFSSTEETASQFNCVQFVTSKTNEITARVKGYVPAVKTHTDDKWLSITPGGCSTTGQELTHIGPDTDGSTATAIPMSVSWDGCTLKIIPGKVKIDAKGHFCGFEAGSDGDAIYAELPTRSLTVVTDVNQSGCDVSGTDESIKVLNC